MSTCTSPFFKHPSAARYVDGSDKVEEVGVGVGFGDGGGVGFGDGGVGPTGAGTATQLPRLEIC
eukprot:scaffold23269_cov156-Skeletonema_menzelii.AAC.1